MNRAAFGTGLSETKGFFCFSFNKRSPKDALGKLSFFANVFFFLESEAQISKNNYGTMFFMLQQVISSILQKMKIGPKSDIHPFCTKSFNKLI